MENFLNMLESKILYIDLNSDNYRVHVYQHSALALFHVDIPKNAIAQLVNATKVTSNAHLFVDDAQDYRNPCSFLDD